MRERWKNILKTLAFVAILCAVTLKLWSVYGYSDNVHSKAVFNNFYDLPEDSVDAVWIGASPVRFALIPSEAYAHNGVAIMAS